MLQRGDRLVLSANVLGNWLRHMPGRQPGLECAYGLRDGWQFLDSSHLRRFMEGQTRSSQMASTSFDYYMVLPGVVAALSLGRLLKGPALSLQQRLDVQSHPLHLIWAAILFVSQILSWHESAACRGCIDIGTDLGAALLESPQMSVGRGGANSMPPQHRNSIAVSAPAE